MALLPLLRRFVLAGAATAGLIAADAAAADRPKDTIVVGVVSGDARKTMPRLEAMANYLAAHLADLEIRQGRAVVAATNEEMIALLRRGDVDVLSETPFAAVHFAAQAGAEILLREWKRGAPEYRSVLIAKRGSGIRTLADLRGRVLAVEDPGSTTGFLWPLAMLQKEGLNAIEVALHQRPPADAVGYAFAIQEINIAGWVALGHADAGALSDRDWEDFRRTPEGLKSDLEVFYAGEILPRSAVLLRSGLDARLKQRIRETLMAMSDDPTAESTLKTYYKVSRFDDIDAAAAAGLRKVEELYPLVADRIR
jgi:phosphonate transport system substrate-binding protein